MAKESKAEREVREALTAHLEPGETLREFSRGGKQSTSAAWFFFGAIGAAIARGSQPGYMIGLTDKRLILVDVKGAKPTGPIQCLPLSDIKSMKFKRGLYSGNLEIELAADKMKLSFDSRPWFPRAINMAKMMPGI